MAAPTNYTPDYDFSAYQATNPAKPLPGHELDVELQNISSAINGTQTALSRIQRSDGKLQNGSVDEDALAPGLRPTREVLSLADFAFTATTGQTAFTLPETAIAPQNVLVHVNGIRLIPETDYTVAGRALTLTTAPGNGAKVHGIIIGVVSYQDVQSLAEGAINIERRTVLTVEGETVYGEDTEGEAFSLSNNNHIVFGGSPAGPLTLGVDYTVTTEGLLSLNFPVRDGELLHIIAVPRISNSAAQAILNDFEARVRDEADRAEAAAEGLTLRRATIADMKAIVPEAGLIVDVGEMWRGGRFVWREGNYSAQVTADTQGGVYVASNSVLPSAGVWERQFDGPLCAEWFGVIPRGNGNVTDLTTPLNAVSAFAKTYFNHVTFRPGHYYAQNWSIPRGVMFEGLGVTPNTRDGVTTSEFNSLMLDDNGAVFVAMGDTPLTVTMDFCSDGAHVGYTRSIAVGDRNASSAAPFTEMRLFDGTNKNAVGATRATLRSLRPFAVIEDGWNRAYMRNIKIVPSCPGSGETYGLNGYIDAATIRTPANYDFGLFYRNAWEIRLEDVKVVGYWREAGVCNWLPPEPGFTTVTPSNESGLIVNCDIQSGLLMRSGDLFPVVDKTATEIWVRWSASHRFASTGTIHLTTSDTFTGEAAVAYSALAYSTATSPTLGKTGPWLVFTVASTAAYPIGAKIVCIPGQGGSSHTSFENCNISDLAHHRGLQNDVNELAGWQTRFRACIEISGAPMRAVRFERCRFSPVGPLALHVGAARDLIFSGGSYAERRPFRFSAAGSLQSARGGVAIAGPDVSVNRTLWDEGGAACSAQVYFEQAGPLNDTINTLPLGENRASVPFTSVSWFNLRDGNMRAYYPSVSLFGLPRQARTINSTDLANAAHPVNLFGKAEGVRVWAFDTNKEYMALGSGSTSAWADLEGTTNITPV